MSDQERVLLSGLQKRFELGVCERRAQLLKKSEHIIGIQYSSPVFSLRAKLLRSGWCSEPLLSLTHTRAHTQSRDERAANRLGQIKAYLNPHVPSDRTLWPSVKIGKICNEASGVSVR